MCAEGKLRTSDRRTLVPLSLAASNEVTAKARNTATISIAPRWAGGANNTIRIESNDPSAKATPAPTATCHGADAGVTSLMPYSASSWAASASRADSSSATARASPAESPLAS